MRTIKEPDERRNEILDAAQSLFFTKGYVKTTVNDILKEIGIAKGTFYYYFKSKEEVMNAIVFRFVDMGVEAGKQIATNPNLTVHEKILYIMLAQKLDTPDKEQVLEELHDINNAQLHQKSLVETVLRLTPVLQGVVEQGIREKVFATPYPKETIEIILVTVVTLFDDIFNWTPKEMQQKIPAFIYTLETLLGAEKGSFDYIKNVFSQNPMKERDDE